MDAKADKQDKNEFLKSISSVVDINELGHFLFFNTPIGFFRTESSVDGKIVLANPAFLAMYGYTSLQDLESIATKELYWEPTDRQVFINELLCNGRINRRVMRFKKKDGNMFWGAVTAQITRNALTQGNYFDGAVEDITESKKNEIRLLEEKAFSESVIEAMPGLFWLTDENENCVRWNKNVEVVYGYSADELKKMNALKDMVTSESLEALKSASIRALKGGSGYCEYEIVTKKGKKIAFAGDSRLITINNKNYLSCVEIDITKRKKAEEKLKDALLEIKQLKERTDAENHYLINEIKQESRFESIVGSSEPFKCILSTAKKVAPTNATVLILGETGAGKGVLAHLIHDLSSRSKRTLIKLNCANLPSNLIESSLFGHERGAFTGAIDKKIGCFEIANNSTIFLDEIAELPLELQSKLLRVIEDSRFERLGGTKTIAVDVRIIAATNRDLHEEVKTGRFRQDLFYRLNVYPILVPPLRERIDDIPLMVQFFINKFNKSLGRNVTKIPKKTIESLMRYQWPGNIRELQNVIERSVINSSSNLLELSGLPSISYSKGKDVKELVSIQEMEYQHISKVLEATNWIIEGKKGASQILGLNPSTLRGRMRKLGIRRTNTVTQF